ncbi:MAG: carboxypeptidase-like regulatory domain-containing protein, partial [Bacteroidota bacterium]
MNKAFVLLVVLLISIQAIGQELTQTVRGTVTDKNSEQPLPGVNVFIPGSNPVVGTITDENGAFSFEKIPVGRVNLSFSFLGYKQADVQNVIVKSGKEVVLNIQMEEEIISTAEVKVRAFRKDQPVNEMAAISARSFTVEETEKYAGSWGDPSRMAMNYAGVTPAGDQVNDIVIRGNSPNGLLWRMEGINIPNPNHFGALGSTGGPVSMLNNNVLDNSDFYTGAFPAEFGNAVSGVFDLNLRTGNNQKREYLAQVGFNGFEIGVEGPFHKSSRASYLANYRYSTMGVIEALGVDMGIGAVPYYQDLVFNIDIPGVKYGKLSFFGLGGLSNIHFNYDSGDTTMGGTDFTSDMGVAGLSYTYYLSDKSRIKTSLAVSGTRTTTKDSLLKLNEIKSMYGDNSTEVKYSAVIDWKKKF